MPFIHPLPEMTADGSHTLRHPLLGESYHSSFGAATESRHVYIEAGLHQVSAEPVHILEMGFGTGLNALLTLSALREPTDPAKEAKPFRPRHAVYYTVEAYPITQETVVSLNYEALTDSESYHDFLQMHAAPWDTTVSIAPDFTLYKHLGTMESWSLPDQPFDLVYYDAFAYDCQPELWSTSLFQKIYQSLRPGALLVTYAAKGEIKRALRAAGFEVKRLPGAPGKHHMLQASVSVKP